jgi:hypothetical protein
MCNITGPSLTGAYVCVPVLLAAQAVGGAQPANSANDLTQSAVWVFTSRGQREGAFVQIDGPLNGHGSAPRGQQGYSVALSPDGSLLAFGGPSATVALPNGAVWVYSNVGGGGP